MSAPADFRPLPPLASFPTAVLDALVTYSSKVDPIERQLLSPTNANNCLMAVVDLVDWAFEKRSAVWQDPYYRSREEMTMYYKNLSTVPRNY